MSELGLDYSYARPGGAALAAAGVKAVGRYLAPDGDGREIEKPEYDDLVANGIKVWFVREGAADGMLGGFAKGVSDAQVAVANLARLGLSDQVVYAAADWDVLDSQFGVCDDYMRGFASVVGSERTGIYAGLHLMNHLHSVGLAVWFWQAGATSWNHGEDAQMTVHLEQTTNVPPFPGTDHNYIYTANYGQAGGAVVPAEIGDESMKIITVPSGTIALVGEYESTVYTTTAGGQGFSIGSNAKAYGHVDGLTEDEVHTLVTESRARRIGLINDIIAKVNVDNGTTDYAALGKAIAENLPDGNTVTADELATALAARLGVAVKPAA
jgi:hypothetical protein